MDPIEAFKTFGIDVRLEFSQLRELKLVEPCLEELKERAKKKYRKLIKMVHPDKGGSHEEALELIEAIAEVLKVKVIIEEQPLPIRSRVFTNMEYADATGTTNVQFSFSWNWMRGSGMAT